MGSLLHTQTSWQHLATTAGCTRQGLLRHFKPCMRKPSTFCVAFLADFSHSLDDTPQWWTYSSEIEIEISVIHQHKSTRTENNFNSEFFITLWTTNLNYFQLTIPKIATAGQWNFLDVEDLQQAKTRERHKSYWFCWAPTSTIRAWASKLEHTRHSHFQLKLQKWQKVQILNI